MNSPVLTPILALVLWSLVVWAWMLATRIPAMRAARLHPQTGKFTAELATKLPEEVRAVSDNYNHLMEQPTIFYALATYVALTSGGDGVEVGLAWGYVVLRVIHSVIQITANIVVYRFYVFAGSTLVLAALAIKAAAHLIH